MSEPGEGPPPSATKTVEPVRISRRPDLRYPVPPFKDGRTPIVPAGSIFATFEPGENGEEIAKYYRADEDLGIVVKDRDEFEKTRGEKFQHRNHTIVEDDSHGREFFMVKVPAVPVEVEELEPEQFRGQWDDRLLHQTVLDRVLDRNSQLDRLEQLGRRTTLETAREDRDRGYRKIWTKLVFVTHARLPKRPEQTLF